ncbi:MAG: alpha-isopropylmalate synthase regulatory domain-containing protein, partial [Leucothrix sp.]
ITMAMNLYSQGIDPKIDMSNIQETIDVVEFATELKVHARHPWAGELVYTAFSGSHQDAIRKSMKYHEAHDLKHWNVAYLPIDPLDLGREYEAVIRINSQSGKGGVALVLERDYGIELPKWMHVELSKVVQHAVEQTGEEISPEKIKALYEENFVATDAAWQLSRYDLSTEGGQVSAQFVIGDSGEAISGHGAGVVEALCDALTQKHGKAIRVMQFDEHSLSRGTRAQALASTALLVDGATYAAVAVNDDISTAALQSVLTAFQKSVA